jgi:hypothetical protein
MNKKQIDAVLENVRSWLREDQQELVELRVRSKRAASAPTLCRTKSVERSRQHAAVRLPTMTKSRPSRSGMGLHETSLSGASAQ